MATQLREVDYSTGELLPGVPIGPLAAALAKAQASFPTVTRSKTVRVTTKTGGSYTFSYAPLDVILDAVRKPLADNGLAVVQLLDRDALVTVLLHESGASLEGRTTFPATADVQAFGSAITYLRRYAIQALLGIAAEEDDDGNSATGNQADPTPRRARSAAPTGGNAPNGAPTSPRPASATAATPAASTPAGELTDEEWEGLVEEPKSNGRIGIQAGIKSAELFQMAEDSGVERAVIYSTSKKLFGDKRVVDLTDSERAGLWEEVTA